MGKELLLFDFTALLWHLLRHMQCVPLRKVLEHCGAWVVSNHCCELVEHSCTSPTAPHMCLGLLHKGKQLPW